MRPTSWILILISFSFLPSTLFADTDKPPNILFIMVDDMGYGDLPCYGAKDVATPNIDRLAKQGVRLTNYYAAGAECTPTRTALMSGLYPQRIGGLECAIGTGNVGRYDDAIRLRKSNELGLPVDRSVLASSLSAAGYATAIFGKWHLGYEQRYHPLNHGFDQFFGFLGGYVDYYRHREFSELDVLYDGRKPVSVDGYMTHLITDRAVQFVEHTRPDAPFFLYVSYSTPHFPFQPPKKDPGRMVSKEQLTKGKRSDYVKMLEDMDRGVGRILKALQARHLQQNTLVVFASDHGAIKPGRNFPLQGFKSGLFEGGIRTACIMRWPGRLPAGIVSDQPTITMDLTESFMTVAGGKRPPGYKSDGIDIVELLAKNQSIVPRKLFWRAKRGDRVWRAVRDGNWKHVTRLEEGILEAWLFNLDDDPGERRNLITQHQKKSKALATLLMNWERETQPAR